jgi:L-glyceraldehyde 3-phosphate reductase
MNFVDNPADYGLPVYKPNSKRFQAGCYRLMSNTQLAISSLSVGCWRLFGGNDCASNSNDVFSRALDLGYNHFDLANNYGRPPGSSEVNFGAVLKISPSLRDELIISSKCGYEMLPGPNGFGLSAKHLRSQLDASLKRLQLEYLDIFYLHCYNTRFQLDEVLGFLKQSFSAGKFLYLGISSFPECVLLRLIEGVLKENIPVACLQYNISLLNPTYIDLCRSIYEKFGITTIAFSPFAQGILTSSYALNSKHRNSRVFEKDTSSPTMIGFSDSLIQEFQRLASRNQMSIELMTLKWLLSLNFISSIVYGPRNSSQVLSLLSSEDSALVMQPTDLLEEIKNSNYPVLVDDWTPRNFYEFFV